MGAEVKVPKLGNLTFKMQKALKVGIEDCTGDLRRVASLRSPVNEGTLEQSATSNIRGSGINVQGIVSFSARHKGFNYAVVMDKGNYNLGKKSKEKSKRGVRSKFSSKTFKVGTGFLTETAKDCQEGYSKHVESLIGKAISEDGFGG